MKKNKFPSVKYAERYKHLGLGLFFITIIFQYFVSGNLWSRSEADDHVVIHNSSLNLLADKTLKGIVLYYCLAGIQVYKNKQIGALHLFTVFGIAFLTNFPAAVPRYWIATLYLGLILSWFRPFFEKRKQLFSLMLTCSLLLIFPLFNLARMNKSAASQLFSSWESTKTGIYTIYENAFCGQDFDAYIAFKNTIIYVQQNGISRGKQLLTDCLFFVPRSFWPGKSIGSGAIVNPPKPGSDFTNYSCPLMAEGYIDFGLAGALIFVGLFAYLGSRYDRYFWQAGHTNLQTLLYPSFIGMSFFILRGDLLSSFAYTAGIAFAGWLFHLLLSSTSGTSTK